MKMIAPFDISAPFRNQNVLSPSVVSLPLRQLLVGPCEEIKEKDNLSKSSPEQGLISLLALGSVWAFLNLTNKMLVTVGKV